MSEEQARENAEAAPATDDQTAPSATDEDQLPEGQEEGQPTPAAEPEDPTVILTRNTQDRFNKLTSTIKDQQSQIEQLQRKTPINFDSDEPKADDYDDGSNDPKYIAEHAAHVAEKRVVERLNRGQEQDRQSHVSQALQNQLNVYNQKVVALEKETPDFQAVMAGSQLISQDALGNLTPAAAAILEVDNSPETAYRVASDPDIALRLNRSTPTQAAIIIARLSDQLTVIPASKNTAPPPIGSEGGKGLATADDGLLNIKGAKFE